MDIRDHRALKDAARQSLAGASYDPKKLILIHTGVILLLSLILTVADYLLEQQIGSTGGLSGMGMRSVLSTVQTVMRFAQTVALPFWQIGYLFTTLKISRGETVCPATLAEGFRRFGPVLRLELCMGALYLAIGMACSYASSFVFFLTPWAQPLMEKLLPLMSDPSLMQDTAALEEAMASAMLDAMVPILIIFGVIFLAVSAPVFYNLRMAQRCLMDEPEKGALAAMRKSRTMMRGNCIDLFKLDLRFWWFYVLDALVTVVLYGDTLLNAAGVSLPVDSTTAFFAFTVLYLVCQLALYYWRRNEVETTYSHAYCALRGPRPPKPEPTLGSHPWND